MSVLVLRIEREGKALKMLKQAGFWAGPGCVEVGRGQSQRWHPGITGKSDLKRRRWRAAARSPSDQGAFWLTCRKFPWGIQHSDVSNLTLFVVLCYIVFLILQYVYKLRFATCCSRAPWECSSLFLCRIGCWSEYTFGEALRFIPLVREIVCMKI